MAKKGPGGKKKKGKKPKGPLVQAFDLDFISAKDLKKYISILEKELELMRKDCAFYSTNKEWIMAFLESRKILTSQKEASIICKNVVMDDLIKQLRELPEKFNEKSVISQKVSDREKCEKELREAVARSTAQADHLDEEYVLKKMIVDIDKRLECSRFLDETTIAGMKETFWSAQKELDTKHNEKLADAMKLNIHQTLKAHQDFTAGKAATLFAVMDIHGFPEGTKESFMSELKHMQDFFHDLSANNHVVIEQLKEKLALLFIENKKLTANLKDVSQENMELELIKPTGFQYTEEKAAARITKELMNIQAEKDIEKLKFRNDVLRQHLRSVTETMQESQKQFITATRHIYQKAEFKACLLEEAIKMNLIMESRELEKKYEQPTADSHDKKQKVKGVGDILKVIPLKV